MGSIRRSGLRWCRVCGEGWLVGRFWRAAYSPSLQQEEDCQSSSSVDRRSQRRGAKSYCQRWDHCDECTLQSATAPLTNELVFGSEMLWTALILTAHAMSLARQRVC